MELVTLKAQTREVTRKKGTCRALRAADIVPGVVYGGDQGPVSLKFDRGDLFHVLHGHAGEYAIVQIDVQDKPDANTPAIVRQIQHHPLTGSVLHADFMRIRLDQKLETMVSVELVGTPEGVKEGGVLDHQMREVEVECLALDVPESITLDVSGLQIGDSLHVSDLVPPEGVEIISDLERAVASVMVPRALVEEEVAEEGEELAEPEVIGEETEGEEEDEG